MTQLFIFTNAPPQSIGVTFKNNFFYSLHFTQFLHLFSTALLKTLKFNILGCAGFRWDRVNFLHSELYRAVVWICAEHRADNIEIFCCCCCCCWTELTQSQCLFCFLYCHKGNGAGCAWEETQMGQVTQSDQRGIPEHVTSCPGYKVWGRRRKGGMFGLMVFVFPNHH